jgi:hypothetical protein
LNSIKFYINLKFWVLEAFLYVPLALLVKFPAISLYIYFFIILFFISSLLPALTERRDLFFLMRQPSCNVTLPLPFYITPFKPNISSKESNSKVFSETPFKKIISDYLLNYL